MSLTVRTATVDDAAAIAHLRVDTWRAAYAGLIAPPVLEALDAEAESQRRAAGWDERHADPRASEFVADVDGVTAGWAAVGPSTDTDLPRNGQLFALYARPEYWSQGIGHALMIEAEHRLRSAGFRRAHLWVLDGNERAASFYEAHGWREDGRTITDERRGWGGDVYTLFERRRVRSLKERIPPR